MTRIGTDHHNPPVPTDQPPRRIRLDARVYLHDCRLLFYGMSLAFPFCTIRPQDSPSRATIPTTGPRQDAKPSADTSCHDRRHLVSRFLQLNANMALGGGSPRPSSFLVLLSGDHFSSLVGAPAQLTCSDYKREPVVEIPRRAPKFSNCQTGTAPPTHYPHAPLLCPLANTQL